jgi:YihY family inner membrane protein
VDVLDRADRVQQQRRWLAFPLAVFQKFTDDQAGNLASLLAYYAFFSVFPLLMVMVTVLGFVLQGQPALQDQVFDTAIGFFPLIGRHAALHPLTGSVLALVVGIVLALFSGLSVVSQAQVAFNTVLAVPRSDWPGFLPRLLRSAELLVVGGGGLVLTTLISGAVTGAGSLGLHLGVGLRVVGAVLAVVLDTLLFTVLFKRLTVRDVGWRESLPGAAFAAVGWYALQLGGTALATHYLQGASATYGTFAAVIGLLSFFHVEAQLTLYAAEINAVRIDGLWPRGLRSMVNTPTTEADHRAYASYAERDRFADPEQEEVHVRFPQREEGSEAPSGGGEPAR